MTDESETASEEDSESTDKQEDERSEMSDVDHSHPDSEETFTETGVYDRGRKHRDETDDDEE